MSAEETVIRPGAGVDATDGRLGTVDEVRVRPATGELAGLVVRRGWTDQLLYVDGAQVDRVAGDGTVRLRSTRAEAERHAGVALGATGGSDAGVRADGQALRVPILAERLHAGVQPVDLGELRVHKRVETAEETVRQAVARDELDVERVPVNRPLAAPVGQRTEGEWLVIPVLEEVLVVRTQLMLKEEVRIRTRRVTAEQTVRETVRRERVELEDATRDGVRGLPAAAADGGTAQAPEAPAVGVGPEADTGPGRAGRSNRRARRRGGSRPAP
jgi:uncharacterized protein (TIGR02271 family)